MQVRRERTLQRPVYDIGPGRGALVIYPSERFRGREIEIVRIDGSLGESTRR